MIVKRTTCHEILPVCLCDSHKEIRLLLQSLVIYIFDNLYLSNEYPDHLYFQIVLFKKLILGPSKNILLFKVIESQGGAAKMN